MPLYEYTCPKCGEEFEEIRMLSERDEPTQCPKCGHEAAMDRHSSLVSAAGRSGPEASSSCGSTSSGFG